MVEPAHDAKVTLRKVSSKTVRKICDLSVAEGQKKFVAKNSVSMAEAYFCKEAWFRAIYAGEVPVGFVMLWENPELGKYCLWRFMIDAKYQGRDYGRKAMDLVIRRVKKQPNAKALTLSMVKAEGGPEPFYRKFGFELTGKVVDGQHVMKLDLASSKY